MAVADEIKKVSTSPRVVVELNDGATSHYYSFSSFYLDSGTIKVQARLTSLSPINFSSSDVEIEIPTSEIMLADNDGALSALSITQNWTVTIHFGFKSLTIANWNSIEMDVVAPPEYNDGGVSLQLESATRRLLGECRLPQVNADDAASKNEFDNPTNINYIPAAYFGSHELETGAIQCKAADRSGRLWFIGVVAEGDSDNYLTTSEIDVFITTARSTFIIEDNDFLNVAVSYTTLTRSDDYPTAWRLYYVAIDYDDASGLSTEEKQNALLNIDKVSVNIDRSASAPSDSRADGESKTLWTPADVLLSIGQYYLSDDSGAQVHTAGINTTSFTAVRDDMENNGIAAQFSIKQRKRGIDIIQAVAAESGMKLATDFDGKIGSVYFHNNYDVAIDQQQTVGTTSTGAGGAGTRWQSFTAGVSGILSKVEVLSGATAYSGTIEIRDDTGGLLYTTTISGAAINDWFAFYPNITVVAGVIYRIVVTGSGLIQANHLDPYPGGAYYYNSIPFGGGLYDAAFRTTVTALPAAGELRSWYMHCMAISRADSFRLNEIIAKQEQTGVVRLVQDSDSQTTEGLSAADKIFINLNQSSMKQAAWRTIQKNRIGKNARTFQIEHTIAAFDDQPGDILRLTERWTPITEQAVQIDSIEFNFMQWTANLVVQDLSGWTNTIMYTMQNEPSLERTYPSTTATVSTATTNVTLSTNVGDTYTIAINDIFETRTDDNNKSKVVTSAPAWSGSAWVMIVDSVLDANEAIAAGDWKVYKSYVTASAAEQETCGFVSAATTEIFSGGDPGHTMEF